MGGSASDLMDMAEVTTAEHVRQALLAAGVSNFELVARSEDNEPLGYCVQFSFVEGNVYPDDACRFLATLVQATLPDLQVFNSRTWSAGGARVVCICTRPRPECDGIILLDELGPIHAAVRRNLYDSRILSSPNILSGEWPNYRRDRHGRFGFVITVGVVRPTGHYTFPRDVLLTVTYEPQGRLKDHERRVEPLLLSIRESLVETGNFRYVLTAGDRATSGSNPEILLSRHVQLGFNVTDVCLLREEREWEAL
jgi:hypothetical protein